MQAALEVRAKPPIIIEHDQIYDLSQYDARVEDIGHDKPYISSYIIKRKDEDGWFPENLMVLLQVPGRDEVVPVSPDQFKEWEKELEAAEKCRTNQHPPAGHNRDDTGFRCPRDRRKDCVGR